MADKTHSRLRRVAAIAATTLLLECHASNAAVTRTYVGPAGTGDWFTTTNWTPNGQPQTGNDVFVTANDGVFRSLNFNPTGPLFHIYGAVRLNNVGSGAITLVNRGQALEADSLDVGKHAFFIQFQDTAATFLTNFNVSGGIASISDGSLSTVNVTHTAGTIEFGAYHVSGTYRLQGGTLSTQALVVNNGLFDFVSGGADRLAKIVNNGTIRFNSVNTMLGADVENHGSIEFAQFSAGLRSLNNFVPMTIPGSITFRTTDDQVGITQRAGTITMNSGSNVQTPMAAVSGGTWNQLGGQLTGGSLRVGSESAGTYLISGGTADFGRVNVGPFGRAGTLVQTGGWVRTGDLAISQADSGLSTLRIAGGLFDAAGASITHQNGLIEQTGGQSYFDVIAGAGTVLLSGSASLTCSQLDVAALRVGGDAKMLSSFRTNRLTSLAFEEAGGTVRGTWDVVDGSIVVDYAGGSASPLPAIRRYLASGYAGGEWTGSGLNTSYATMTPSSSHLTALGYAEAGDVFGFGGGTFDGENVDDSAVLIKYTYYGDANLSGAIDFDDYVQIDIGFILNRTGWVNGDFDYNGVVDFDDYVLIDVGFSVQSGTLSRALAYLDGTDRAATGAGSAVSISKVIEHFEQFGLPYAQRFIAAVPEPATAVGPAAIAITAIGRRQRASIAARRRGIRQFHA